MNERSFAAWWPLGLAAVVSIACGAGATLPDSTLARVLLLMVGVAVSTGCIALAANQSRKFLTDDVIDHLHASTDSGASLPAALAAALDERLRRQAEESRQQAQAGWHTDVLLASLVTEIPGALAVVAKDGAVVVENPAFTRIAGAKGARLSDRLGQAVVDQIEHALLEGRRGSARFTAAGTAGEATLLPLVRSAGSPAHSVAIILADDEKREVALEFASMIGAAGVGNFSGRLAVAGDDDFAQRVAHSVNHLLETTEARLTDVGRVMSALAAGDLTRTVSIDFEAGANALADQFREHVPAPFVLDTARQTTIASRSVATLTSAGRVLNENFDVVDRFTQTTGALATLFARAGDDFVRIATTVKNEAGQRAVGTLLDRQHKAYPVVLAGRRFIGPAHLFGNDYMSSYEGIRDASGNVVGVLYIGFDLSPQRNLFIGLCNAIGQTVGKLTEIIGDIKAIGASIEVAARELASGSSELQGRTEQQVETLTRTSSDMQELTGDAERSARSAHEASQFAAEASSVAQRGGRVMSEVVETMESIQSSSRRIADITGVIDGIAFQTNILALNAAVEAARAGEQGRGFAVVAAEVRNLAQRSASAAKEIKQLIGDSVERVGAGNRLVSQAGETMSEVVRSAERVTQVLSEIAASAANQTAHIAGVNQALREIEGATQQNAEVAASATTASAELSEQVEKLARSMNFFRHKTDDIQSRAGTNGARVAAVAPGAPLARLGRS